MIARPLKGELRMNVWKRERDPVTMRVKRKQALMFPEYGWLV